MRVKVLCWSTAEAEEFDPLDCLPDVGYQLFQSTGYACLPILSGGGLVWGLCTPVLSGPPCGMIGAFSGSGFLGCPLEDCHILPGNAAVA